MIHDYLFSQFTNMSPNDFNFCFRNEQSELIARIISDHSDVDIAIKLHSPWPSSATVTVLWKSRDPDY